MTFVALTFLWGFAAVWYFIEVIVGVFLFLLFSYNSQDFTSELIFGSYNICLWIAQTQKNSNLYKYLKISDI